MKAILISDHAKWCALMMNGDKTVEVRKGTTLYKAIQKLIDEYGYADIYVYCTKKKSRLGKIEKGEELCGQIIDKEIIYKYPTIFEMDNGGKVIFKFRCYKVEKIGGDSIYQTARMYYLLQSMCLKENELLDYLNGQEGCAIRISDLEIFDRPRELSEFGVKSSPQSYRFIEVE